MKFIKDLVTFPFKNIKIIRCNISGKVERFGLFYSNLKIYNDHMLMQLIYYFNIDDVFMIPCGKSSLINQRRHLCGNPHDICCMRAFIILHFSSPYME